MTASKAFYQCVHCGTVHKIEDDKTKLSEELYSKTWCPHCKEVTKQLWVGNNPEDVYLFEDITLDNRYYKTK